MSVTYSAILWNKQKKKYDRILWAGILLLLLSFAAFQFVFHPDTTVETLIIRATGAYCICTFAYYTDDRAIVSVGCAVFALVI